MVKAVSAIAMFSTARSRLLSEMERRFARELICRLIPMNAGIPLPEDRKGALIVGAR
jgi:hypothetical protein